MPFNNGRYLRKRSKESFVVEPLTLPYSELKIPNLEELEGKIIQPCFDDMSISSDESISDSRSELESSQIWNNSKGLNQDEEKVYEEVRIFDDYHQFLLTHLFKIHLLDFTNVSKQTKTMIFNKEW